MYKRPLRSNELYHWGMKKGAKAEKHKYIARIEDGTTIFGTPKYRYFYTQAELAAWRAQKNPQQQTSKTSQSSAPQITSLAPKQQQTNALTSAKPNNDQSITGIKEKAGDVKDKIKDFFSDLKKDKDSDDKKDQPKENKPSKVKEVADKIKEFFHPGIDIKVDDAVITKPETANNQTNEEQKEVPKDQSDKYEKYDNEFTEKEAFDNIWKSGWANELATTLSDYGYDCKTDIDVHDALYETLSHPEGESYADMAQRAGFFDETQPGAHPESFDDLVQLDEDMDDDEDMEEVNADNLYEYGDEDNDGDGYPDKYDMYGYSNNCAYCTLAYDMRQRGYDVEASAKSQSTLNTEDVIESWYEGGEFTHTDTVDPKDLEQDILKTNSEGARGQFCMYFEGGGGHSVSYEVKNGEVLIRDCQLNQEWKLKDYPCLDYLRSDDPLMYMRTDNLKPTKKALVGVKNKK